MPREISAPFFDLAKTLDSGQVFHWFLENDGSYSGLSGHELLRVRQTDADLQILSGTEETVRHVFALDHPLEQIVATFPRDEWLGPATDFCHGLRIMRQEPWECLATFITSALKQVPHIRQISLDLRQRFGEKISGEFHAYPTPVALAEAGEAALRNCRLGFRAKSLAATARQIADGNLDLESLRALPTAAVRNALCTLPGVGEKVANCVLLFAYERLEAFPIDVWIERVLRELYFAKKPAATSKELREFSANYFGPYAGYAQQYLFHHARTKKLSNGRHCSLDKINPAMCNSR